MKLLKNCMLGVMLFTMLLGVAYATTWTQEFQVFSTVDTGELAIKVTPIDATPNDEIIMKKKKNQCGRYYEMEIVEDGFVSHGQYMQAFIEQSDENDNDLVVTINDIYPGAEVIYGFEVENTGTLGVRLDTIDLTYEKYQDLFENQADRKADLSKTLDDLHSQFEITYAMQELDENVEFADVSNYIFHDKESFLSLVRTYVMDLDEQKTTTVFVKMVFNTEVIDNSKTWEISENEFENMGIEYLISVNYKQFNEPVISSIKKVNAGE